MRKDSYFKEIWDILKEVSEKQKNAEQEMKEFRDEVRELKQAQKKTDEQLKKTEREIDKVARDIGGGLGRAAEGLSAPAVPKVFKELGIEVEEVQQRVKALAPDGNVKQEVDLLCPARLNGKRLILVGEVKAHFTSEYLQYFLEELPYFKENFPGYKELEVIGFIAGLNVDRAVSKSAFRKGLYILVPAGEGMRMLNSEGFKPRIW